MTDPKSQIPGANLPATDAPRAITPEVLPPEVEENEPAAEGWQRIFWIIVAILCAGWILIPNYFIIPIPFFIDEGIAGIILATALAKLGIKIPILNWFFHRKAGRMVAKKRA